MSEIDDEVKRKKLDEAVLFERNRRKARKIVDRAEAASAPELVIRKISSVARVKADRVFGGRFERGSFSFIVGQGEVGKGVVSSDIIARFTTGEPFPGETQRRTPLRVMMCVVEDSEQQVAGRLEAAGADLDLVDIITGPRVMRGGLEMTSAMRLDSDAGPLVKHALQCRVGAFFIETVVEHLGDRYHERKISTNSESEVRNALAPFRAICKEGNLFGWALIHPRKGASGDPSENISGSAAFYNVPRLTMQVFKDPSDSDRNPRRLLCSSKANNLPRRPTTYRFKIDSWERDSDFPRAVWGIEGKNLEDDRTIEDVQNEIFENQKNRKDLQVMAAEKLLQEILSFGLAKPEDIYSQAKAKGISEKSVDRAKSRLGIVSVKEGFPAQVIGWKFPDSDL